LKYLGSNVGSRRLTQEHRCVDLVKADRIEFLQGRYPYSEAINGDAGWGMLTIRRKIMTIYLETV
jgi:hypothetical protein